MYDTRLRLSNQVGRSKNTFQDLVFKTIIHRNVTGESPSYGETIIIHDLTSRKH